MPTVSRHHRKVGSRRWVPPARGIDWVMLGLVVLLAVFGVLMVFNASNVDAYFQFGDKFHFLKLQVIWLLTGLVAAGFMAVIPFPLFKKISLLFFGLTVLLLIIVLIPGISTTVQGAKRWLYLGSFGLQPSELLKLATVLYLPAFLTRHTQFLPFASIVLFIVFLLLLEPDLGTAIIFMGVAIAGYFLAGAPLRYFVALLLAIIVLGGLAVIVSPYRYARLQTFFNPSSDPLGASYHIRQVLLSLGSGGLTGTGIGRSRQKFQYLPEASTDSIFAVTAEETGFIGAIFILGLYAFIFVRGFHESSLIADPYARLAASSVLVWLTVQTILNIASMVVLVPLTGVPLPLISYGGSSLVTVLMGVGLYINASRLRSIS